MAPSPDKSRAVEPALWAFAVSLVLLVGPVIQALLAAVIMNAPGFYAYAAAASVFAAVMIFTHTFAFGLMARLEPSGRAMAATPAMLMVGAAIGTLIVPGAGTARSPT